MARHELYSFRFTHSAIARDMAVTVSVVPDLAATVRKNQVLVSALLITAFQLASLVSRSKVVGESPLGNTSSRCSNSISEALIGAARMINPATAASSINGTILFS